MKRHPGGIALSIALFAFAGAAAGQHRSGGCPASPSEIERQIAGFRGHPPSVLHLGRLSVRPNAATAAVRRAGLSAVDALLRASQGQDRVVAMYALYTMRDIFSTTKSDSAAACKASAVPVLRKLRERYVTNARDLLDVTILGRLDVVLDEIDVVPGPGVGLPLEPCCVKDAEILVSGTFAGEKRLDDYFPDLAEVIDIEPAWDKTRSNEAGPFDIALPRRAGWRRAGEVMQFIATCTGIRALCTFTQHYTVPISTYADLQATDVMIDDFAEAGIHPSDIKRLIEPDKISMADPPSIIYGPQLGFTNFDSMVVWVTCAISSSTNCPNRRCCAEWSRYVTVQDMKILKNTITKHRTWCE